MLRPEWISKSVFPLLNLSARVLWGMIAQRITYKEMMVKKYIL